MTTAASILLRAIVSDGTTDFVKLPLSTTVADVVLDKGKLEQVTLSAAFTALSPPTGAHLAIIHWVSGTASWTLKGVNGDTGIALGTPTATSPPILVPVSSASIGITADAAGACEVLWL